MSLAQLPADLMTVLTEHALFALWYLLGLGRGLDKQGTKGRKGRGMLSGSRKGTELSLWAHGFRMYSATNMLCDHRQVTYPLWTYVSSSIMKWLD
jgi:hypothetical protein